MAKKRAYIYVDVDKYERLKRLLGLMGVTITDFFDQSMTEFLDKMEDVVLNNDVDAFLRMMTKNVDELQEQIKNEFQK